MLVVTLLANPENPVLDASLPDALKNAWGGMSVTWLSPNIAAEFKLSHMPDNFEQVWMDLQKLQIDLLIHPQENRRKSILLADMDSTMIEQECIDELAVEAGIGDEVAKITTRAMNGELEFQAALHARVNLLEGLKSSVIDDVLRKRITYKPGGKTLLATMKSAGAYTALVSGGFTAFTQVVAQTLGFDENRANQLLEQDGILTGKVADPVLGRDEKVLAMQDIAAQRGQHVEDVIAVGDGANDLGMLNLAGTGIALHAKPTVQVQTKLKINHGDLTALLFLQGYSEDEFC